LVGLKDSNFGSWSLRTHHCYRWPRGMDLVYATPSTTFKSCMFHNTFATYIFHLILYPIQCCTTRSHFQLLPLDFCLISSLISTKPRVEMVVTLCSNLYPWDHFSQNISLAKNHVLDFHYKTNPCFIIAFQTFKIGNMDGVLYHLISFNPKVLSIKIFNLFFFLLLSF
jgi:hypothetical protein